MVMATATASINREIPDKVLFKLSSEQSNAFHVLGGSDEYRSYYSDITRCVYGGQAGGGKSVLISAWLDTLAKLLPETRYYIGRERLKDAKESILLTYFDYLKVSKSQVKYNDKDSHITYRNGSRIYLLDVFHYPSDPNYDSLGSREYTAGAIEEGITVSRKGADILLSRTRYKHDVYNLTPKQLITCNPGEGWIKNDIVVPHMEGRGKHNNIFIRATLESNPNKHFADAYRKNLYENLSDYDRARLLYGDWNAHPKTGAEYLKNYNADKHIGPVEYNKDQPLHLSFDENVHPYITCLVFQIKNFHGLRIIYQLDEICLRPPLNSRRHVCNEIISRYKGHSAGMFIYGDASSLKNETGKEYGENFFTDILTYLKQFNPRDRVPKKNPAVVSKGGFLDKILGEQYRNIKLVVSGKCVDSNADYSYTLEDEDGGILKKREKDPDTGITMEKHGHHVDALSYFVCEAFMGDYNYYLGGDRQPIYETGNDRDYTFRR